eukprot:TRINITY_DN384_c0_g1_i3.p1 TRINITY_DN384_c0_g1~~TRINITY_DN384_c0_g1_i3.p1  ORF type:complete len:185 (+),score=53.55 TRINITY_DN384_c0_g1_i3:579-1133(+)
MFNESVDQVALVLKPDQRNIILAELDADVHADIGDRYNIAAYPTVLLFKSGQKTSPVELPLTRWTSQELLQQISVHSNTQRRFDGVLADTVGRVESLDTIAGAFKQADAPERAALMVRAEAAVRALSGAEARRAEVYLRVMRKVAQGEAVESIQQRWTKMYTKATADTSRDMLAEKLNVLRAFL